MRVLHRTLQCEHIVADAIHLWTEKRKSMEMVNSMAVPRSCITHSTYVHSLLLDVHNTRAAFLNHPNHYRWRTAYRLMHCSHDLGRVKQQISPKETDQERIQHQIGCQHLEEREKCHGNTNFFSSKWNEIQWNECVRGCVMCFKFFFDIQIIWIWWWFFSFSLRCSSERYVCASVLRVVWFLICDECK